MVNFIVFIYVFDWAQLHEFLYTLYLNFATPVQDGERASMNKKSLTTWEHFYVDSFNGVDFGLLLINDLAKVSAKALGDKIPNWVQRIKSGLILCILKKTKTKNKARSVRDQCCAGAEVWQCEAGKTFLVFTTEAITLQVGEEHITK